MNYSIISKYRTQIMGIAVLWIAILHATMWFPIEPINWLFKALGQNGVDIFLFLSSFGLYYSWQKDPDTKNFLKKRFLRIIPVFIPIALFECHYYRLTFQESALMVSTLYFWKTGIRTNWYISAIIVLYLLSPIYLRVFEKKEKIATIISITISLIIRYFFFVTPYTVFFARIPVFLLGFYIGYLSYNNKEIDKKMIIIYMLSFVICIGILRWSYNNLNEYFLWDFGIYFYPMVLVAVPFCLLFANLFDFCNRYSIPLVNSLFYKVGSVSLEFYLLHELMIKIVPNIITVNPYYSAYGIILNVVIIFMTYYAAKYYHDTLAYLATVIKDIYGKKKEKVKKEC